MLAGVAVHVYVNAVSLCAVVITLMFMELLMEELGQYYHGRWMKENGVACRVERTAMGANVTTIVALSAAWPGRMALAIGEKMRRHSKRVPDTFSMPMPNNSP